MLLIVHTTCKATLRQTWHLEVDDRVGEQLLLTQDRVMLGGLPYPEQMAVGDALSDNVLSLLDKSGYHVGDEAQAEWDRELNGIEVAGPPCTCRGYDPADPCGHGDVSEGCPRHDPHYTFDEED